METVVLLSDHQIEGWRRIGERVMHQCPLTPFDCGLPIATCEMHLCHGIEIRGLVGIPVQREL